MQTNLSELASKPIFFERNRVARVYTGGKLFHDFFGDPAEDSLYPEEWVASSVRAMNRDSDDPVEGISKIKGTDVYLNELMEAEKERMLGDRESMGILVKVLDSAIRLAVQSHPDKAFSAKHFNSPHGKAESWLILATRPNAKIYIGFKAPVTRESFLEAMERSETDKNAMEELLNEIPAKKGDVYFISPRLVHAIGGGCLILEVQEPTDFNFQTEAWCGDYKLNDFEKYVGLDRDTALECYDYSLHGEAVVRKAKKAPKAFVSRPGLTGEALIGPGDTDCFSVNRYRINEGGLLSLGGPAIYIVIEGEGNISGPDGYSYSVGKGDYFLMPACAANEYELSGKDLELVECLPPEQDTAA